MIDQIHKWTGGSIEWLVMEFIVYCVFLCTLAILLVKSRFIKIGIDQSKQFEPLYMSFLANYIIEYLFLQDQLQDKTVTELKRKYCFSKRLSVDIEGASIFVCFTEKTFDYIIEKTILNVNK